MTKLVGTCRLRYLLAVRKMSQAELARRLNISPQQVQHYVQDTRMMSLVTAKKIMMILECTFDELYHWDIRVDDTKQ